MKICIDCGAKRAPHAPKYCEACRELHQKQNAFNANVRYKMSLRGTRVCAQCGRLESEVVRFYPTSNKCKDCSNAAMQEKEQDKLCLDCGTIISKRYGSRKRCEGCSKEHRKQQQKQWYGSKKNQSQP